ncbi:MAG: type IV secretory system conjugative DNA transfer family protein [Lachnospiraceae bacterium]|nr:type IV secretory system conjugative DNA transfer family protein [Lachnospiraceae bacterium]
MRETTMGERIFAPEVIISNDTRLTGLNNNDLIIGGSGSGKTGGYIYNLLLNPHGSMIVSDTKGLLHRIFSKYLKEKGYKVHVLDFVNPEKSIAYNPLQYIRRDKAGDPNEADIAKLANIIMPKLDADEPFWEKAAARYISILIGFVLEDAPEDEQTMTSVCLVHQQMRTKKGREFFEEWSREHPDSFAARKYRQMAQTASAEKMWSSIMEFANQGLDVFDFREYEPIWREADSIDIAKLGHEKTVLFVNSSDNDTSMHVLSDLFNTQAMQVLLAEADKMEDGRLPVPCRLILDDFAAAARIENFDNLISIIRSREISVSIIIQSLSQLNHMYSVDRANTILNNCAHVLYLAGKDKATMQYVADYLNQTVHSVLKLPRDKAVFIEEGAQARIVSKLIPYQDKPICKGELSPGR